MKNQRQNKIIELIQNHDIETQEELIDRLRREGYSITQATVSRDIRELKLSKVMSDRGIYKYVHTSQFDSLGAAKFSAALADSITRVDYSKNIVVLKTYPGMAQAVATAIDAISSAEILGCVAGDDTIIVVCVDEAAARAVSEKIKQLIKTV